MSTNTDRDQTPVEPIHEFTIASMVTTSAAEMLHHFGDEIIKLRAHASADTENTDDLKRDYGLLRRQLQRERVELDYKERRNVEGEPHNPMTAQAATDILNQTRRLLQDPSDDVDVDLAVTKMVVRTTLPQLREVTRAQSNEFELTFISDRVISDTVRDETQRANLGKGLYETLGFEYRNLNLRSVVETRAKYTEQAGDGTIMSWGGPDDTRGRSSMDVTQAVFSEVLPEQYARIKWFSVGEENATELTRVADSTDTGDTI